MNLNTMWNILLVEDDEDDYILTRNFLKESRQGQFTLVWAASFEAALLNLAENRPDVVLIDFDLGSRNGLDFLRAARESGCRAPVILLTGHSSYALDLEAMKAGVSDYLEKSQITAPLLERTIRYAIERQQIQARLEEMNEVLEARVIERTRTLAETYELFERVFSMLHVAIAYLDRDFNFIRVNRRYAESDGKTEDFFPGKNHFDLYPNDEAEAIFRWVIETGEPFTAFAKPFEFSAHPERGVSFWDWNLQPVKEPDGTVSGVILNLLDVTERERSRKVLEYQGYLLEHITDAVVALDQNFCYTTWNHAAEYIFGWKREDVIGRKFGDLLRTEFQEGDRDSFLDNLAKTGQFTGEVVQTCKNGRRIPVEIKITSLWDDEDNVTGYVCIQSDITLRRNAEEQAREAYTRLSAQAELTRLMAGAGLDYQKTLDILTRRVAELIGDACQVAVFSEDREDLIPVAFYHPDPGGYRVVAEIHKSMVHKIAVQMGSEAAVQTAPVLIPVVSQEEVRAQFDPDVWPVLERFRVHSIIIAPLIVQDYLFGTLSVTRDCPGHSYSNEDQVFLEALAGRAALLLNNAALYEKAQTELAERKRMEADLNEIQRRLADGAEAQRLNLARELHDGPIQDLYALSLQLRLMDGAFPGGKDDESLAALQGAIQRVIDTLRATSMELRPPVLTRFGLGAAIRSHCEQFRRSQPALKIILDLPEEMQHAADRKEGNAAQGEHPLAESVFSDRALSERARLGLFRIYQVAVTNVIRHARATQVIIRLKKQGGDVVLEVEDNGIGFQVPERWVEMARQGHLGLLGGVERAESLGGEMRVISSPGKGTIVRVVVPEQA